MKKTVLLLTALCLCLSGCAEKSGNPEVFEYLASKYSGADISYDENGYSVVLDNVALDPMLPISTAGYREGPVYDNVDELLDDMNMLSHDVVIGKKTGVSKQYMLFTGTRGGLGWYHTESEVEITDVLYGDASIGDRIILKEWFAVVENDDGDKVVLNSMGDTVVRPDAEYLMVLYESSESELFEGEKQYAATVSPIELGSGMPPDLLCGEVYVKYIVNRDIAVDAKRELQKAADWKQTLKQRGVIKSAELSDEETAMIKSRAEN